MAVGFRPGLLLDASRGDRVLGTGWWYPTTATSGTRAAYELLPGISHEGGAFEQAPADVDGPVYVFSHGRSGTHRVYTVLAEGLAARGYHVVTMDHPGDTTFDWALGTAVSDEDNERQRLDDLAFILDELRTANDSLPLLTEGRPVLLGGHSYGAYTALGGAAAASRAVNLRGVAVLEPYLLRLTAAQLAAVPVATLLVAGANDTTTPADVDPPHAAAHLNPDLLSSVIFEGVGHQGCSDVGLYAEVLDEHPEVPETIASFVRDTAATVTGTLGDPWRPVVERHVVAVDDFCRPLAF